VRDGGVLIFQARRDNPASARASRYALGKNTSQIFGIWDFC
jgi:hypothetical protein